MQAFKFLIFSLTCLGLAQGQDYNAVPPPTNPSANPVAKPAVANNSGYNKAVERPKDPKTFKVNDNGACGHKSQGRCDKNRCCSVGGWCGASKFHCMKGCNALFGVCGINYITTGDKPAPTPPAPTGQYGNLPARKEPAYQNGNSIGNIDVVTMPGTNKLVGKFVVEPFMKLKKAYGGNIQINSGFRTMKEQTYFYNCYKNGNCNGGNLAARPGTSNHQNGRALDINVVDNLLYNWLARNAQKYGWIRTVPSEKWHWEYRPGQGKPFNY